MHALHVTKIDLLIEQQRLLDAIVELNKSKETIEQRYRQQMEENKRFDKLSKKYLILHMFIYLQINRRSR